MTAIIPFIGTPELKEIASRIRDRTKRTATDIIETGRDLIAVKAKLGHGEFAAWLDQEFGWSVRSAQNYMRAADFIQGKNEIIAYLPPSTIYTLAARSTPQAVRDKIVADAEDGRRVDARSVQKLVRDERVTRPKVPIPVRARPKGCKPAGDAKRLERFGLSITCVHHAGVAAADIPLPPLTAEDAEDALAKLNEAISGIRTLMAKIKAVVP